MLTKQHPTVSQSPYSGFNGSPSLEPPSYTTDDLASARYTRHARALEWLRIAFSAITLVLGIAVTACAGVSLHLFDDTHVAAEWMLPLWPMNVDLRPTRATLATGIILMLFSLGYIVLAFAPLRNKARMLNMAGGIMSLLGFLLSLFTTIFVAVITNNLATSQSSGSLVSWTCKWQTFSSVAPDGFNKICDNGTAAYDLVLFLVVLEFIGVAMAGAGFFVEKKLQRAERGRGLARLSWYEEVRFGERGVKSEGKGGQDRKHATQQDIADEDVGSENAYHKAGIRVKFDAGFGVAKKLTPNANL